MSGERAGREAARSALLALARRAADEGAYAEVSRLFRSVTGPIPPEEAARWRVLLVEAGDFEAAGRCAGSAESVFPEEAEAEGQPATGENDDVLDFEPGEREPKNVAVPEAVVANFLRHFGGRADVYARQWYDARRDRGGYWPVREPLSAHVVEQHLLGRLTIGQYVLHPDNTVSFAAVDLDPTPAALEQMRLSGEGAGPVELPALAEYAARLALTAEQLGLPAAVEDTGGVGFHVWLLFSPRIPAVRARALLRELLWRVGAQPPAVSVELFPKQERLSGKGLGNLIKLPLGVHQATLRPSRFLDHTTMTALEGAAALARLRPCDPGAVDSLLASRVVPLRAPAGEDPAPEQGEAWPRRSPSGATPRPLAEALAAIPAGAEATAAVDRILRGCRTLRELVRRAHEGAGLPPEDARILVYTLGLVGRDNDRIEDALKKAGVSRKELERVRRGLQSPVGCKRLASRFHDLCAGCGRPEAPPGGYASPVLFALRSAPRMTRRSLPWPEVTDIGAEGGAGSAPDIERRLARLEAMLAALLGRRGDPR